MNAADFAADHGASDVFVLRRVATARWAHLGGYGRGAGWAGIVEVGTVEEPVLGEALRTGRIIRRSTRRAERVVGPYYARQAVFVPVDRDNLVVLGQVAPAPQLGVADDDLAASAIRLVAATAEVSPAKHLADEMEVLHAMQEMYRVNAASFQETLDSVVAVAVRALSCEVGALLTGSGRVSVCTYGWELPASDDQVRDLLLATLPRLVNGPLCVQDTRVDPLPPPLSMADGVRSYYLVPLPAPVGGLLALLHTDNSPRGFTRLCRQLGLQLVDAAATVVHAADLRERLQAQVDSATQAAQIDALTGLGNRLAWSEALPGAQVRTDHGEAVSVLVLDLNFLKRTNDTHGHAVGDELLRRFARAVRGALRTGDLVCRVGGDELHVLLPVTDGDTCVEVAQRVREAVSAESRRGSHPLSVALGWATAPAGGSVTEAVHVADVAMYADKRRQHADGDSLR